jgi:hypothetical protein
MAMNSKTMNLAVRQAVRHFWESRASQSSRQEVSGKKDQGARSAVTGGAQMDGFIHLFKQLAQEAGIPPESIFARSRFLELPGFFRPTKEWDLLIVH